MRALQSNACKQVEYRCSVERSYATKLMCQHTYRMNALSLQLANLSNDDLSLELANLLNEFLVVELPYGENGTTIVVPTGRVP